MDLVWRIVGWTEKVKDFLRSDWLKMNTEFKVLEAGFLSFHWFLLH